MNIVEIRTKGIGSNFSVINPHDGYRKDNRLWFGECSECGEMVSSSSMSAKSIGWTHTLTKKISETGFQMTSIDYCPKGQQFSLIRRVVLTYPTKCDRRFPQAVDNFVMILL